VVAEVVEELVVVRLVVLERQMVEAAAVAVVMNWYLVVLVDLVL